jgi:transcriptional regulator with XRE-family HTH domain
MAKLKSRQARNPRNQKVATIADVARRAGVSPMTVSRVVNGEMKVREATREKVNAAVAALRYIPNQAARRLAGSRLVRIAVLYSNPSAGYLNELLVGVLNRASLGHLQLVVEKCEAGEGEVDVARALIVNGVNGIILPPPLCDSARLVDLMAESSTPAVAVASGQPDKRICAIGIDDLRAAYDMTRHLLSLGHVRIGFITGHPNQTASARRLAGFRAAMADAGPRGARGARRRGRVQLPLRPGRRRGAAGGRAAPVGDLREQRRHGRGHGGDRPRPRPRRARRPHRRRIRRRRARHDHLAGAHHRAPADRGDGERLRWTCSSGRSARAATACRKRASTW